MKRHPVLRAIASCVVAIFLLVSIAVALLAAYIPFMRIDQGFSRLHALKATSPQASPPPASAAALWQHETGWRALFPSRH